MGNAWPIPSGDAERRSEFRAAITPGDTMRSSSRSRLRPVRPLNGVRMVDLIPVARDSDPYNIVMAGLRPGHPCQTKSLINNQLPTCNRCPDQVRARRPGNRQRVDVWGGWYYSPENSVPMVSVVSDGGQMLRSGKCHWVPGRPSRLGCMLTALKPL
jgi:hypothetical protein